MNEMQKQVFNVINKCKVKMKNRKLDVDIDNFVFTYNFFEVPLHYKLFDYSINKYITQDAWSVEMLIGAILHMNFEGFYSFKNIEEEYYRHANKEIEDGNYEKMLSQMDTPEFYTAIKLHKIYHSLIEEIRICVIAKTLVACEAWNGEKTLILPQNFKKWADEKDFVLPDELEDLLNTDTEKKSVGRKTDKTRQDATEQAFDEVIAELKEKDFLCKDDKIKENIMQRVQDKMPQKMTIHKKRFKELWDTSDFIQRIKHKGAPER